jgi:hypothetical protein
VTNPERQIKRRKKGVTVEVDYQKLMTEMLPQFSEIMAKQLPDRKQYEAAIEALNQGNAGLQDLNKKLVGEYSEFGDETEKRLDAIEAFLNQLALKFGIPEPFPVKSENLKELEALAADDPIDAERPKVCRFGAPDCQGVPPNCCPACAAIAAETP